MSVEVVSYTWYVAVRCAICCSVYTVEVCDNAWRSVRCCMCLHSEGLNSVHITTLRRTLVLKGVHSCKNCNSRDEAADTSDEFGGFSCIQ